MSDGGKGSRPRPFSVDSDTYANNWDRIFGKSDSPPNSQVIQPTSSANQGPAHSAATTTSNQSDNGHGG